MHKALPVAATASLFAIAAFAVGEPKTDFNLVNRLDRLIQARFADPQPAQFGMSRMAGPDSFGAHFVPTATAPRDFVAAHPEERQLVTELEAHRMQVGFYVFGESIELWKPSDLNYRALKGPAIVTAGTPRPAWYPGTLLTARVAGSLPDWNAIYPVAQRAMRSFQDGGAGFETAVASWTLAARPVTASEERCVTCHDQMRIGGAAVKLNQVIGGVLYAYRNAPK